MISTLFSQSTKLSNKNLATRLLTCHLPESSQKTIYPVRQFTTTPTRPAITFRDTNCHTKLLLKTMATEPTQQDAKAAAAVVPPTLAKNDLSDMRKPYRDQDDGIEESKLPSRDPIKLFENWFNMAKESNTIYEPNAFCICTASKDGQPSARMVLLKGFDNDGFRFFSHYSSQKGQNIDENPKVTMLFYWDSFNRQVRVEGLAQKLPHQAGEEYFKRRPQSSQIGAAISDQSSLIESREALMDRYNKLKEELGDAPPPKPSTWGGYLIVPERFEFWQGNTNRVHDRIMFRRPAGGETIDGKLTKPAENGWVMERMLP